MPEAPRSSSHLLYRALPWVLGTLLLLLAGLLYMVRYQPDTLNPFADPTLLIYFLTSANFFIAVSLFFVLIRNLVKLAFERKRRVLGSRFKTKLVTAFLIIAIIPSLGFFWVVFDLMGKSFDTVFNPPLEKVLENGLAIAEQYYSRFRDEAFQDGRLLTEQIREQQLLDDPEKLLEFMDGLSGPFSATVLAADAQTILAGSGSIPSLLQETDWGKVRRGEDVTRWTEDRSQLFVVMPVHSTFNDDVVAMFLLERSVPETVAVKAALIIKNYDSYKQLSLKKRELKESRVWTYGMFYLLIIFTASWFGIYIAKVITKPIESLLQGIHEVSSGNLDYRVSTDAIDELAILAGAFNQMTAELKTSTHAVERSKTDLMAANRALDERRHTIAAILDAIPAGVVSCDSSGHVLSANRAARSILDLAPDTRLVGADYSFALRRAGKEPVSEFMQAFFENPGEPRHLNATLTSDDQTRHVSMTALPMPSDEGNLPGAILVLDDITTLSRAQKIAAWQDVAQRMAHEVKNPLTPIQLSAQRILKNYKGKDPHFEELLKDCIQSITEEVQTLKTLVDEFSKFARLPAPRTMSVQLTDILQSAVALYEGHYEGLSFKKTLALDLPPLEADPEQLKRVFINLLDNAIEAMAAEGEICLDTSYDAGDHRIRIKISDSGRGIPDNEKSKLFEPYFSTKMKGMGLGLAIVSRIITDHNGSIAVSDNHPRGSVFTITLPTRLDKASQGSAL